MTIQSYDPYSAPDPAEWLALGNCPGRPIE
jgi:hypothetical protein